MTDPNRHLRTGQLAPWPKGKPRNEPTAEWLKLKRQLLKLMRDRTQCNYWILARACGVNRGTVRRWFLDRTDERASNPSTESVEKMQAWIKK